MFDTQSKGRTGQTGAAEDQVIMERVWEKEGMGVLSGVDATGVAVPGWQGAILTWSQRPFCFVQECSSWQRTDLLPSLNMGQPRSEPER